MTDIQKRVRICNEYIYTENRLTKIGMYCDMLEQKRWQLQSSCRVASGGFRGGPSPLGDGPMVTENGTVSCDASMIGKPPPGIISLDMTLHVVMT